VFRRVGCGGPSLVIRSNRGCSASVPYERLPSAEDREEPRLQGSATEMSMDPPTLSPDTPPPCCLAEPAT